MKKYVMALDAGTTSNRAILFAADGRIAAVAQREFRQIYPKPGWVERDTEAIAESVPDSNGCVVVPAFTGLGAPYWDQYARGAVLGLTRGVSRAPVERPECIETTAFGAAALAGLAVGFWRNREELAALRRVGRVFSPSWGAFERTAAMKRWHKAVERVRDWAQD